MKIKVILLLMCALVLSSAADARDRGAREKEDSLAVKIGYFGSGEGEEVAGSWDLEVDGAAAFGAEYYSLTRKDVAVSVSAFYSRPDIDGVIWDGANWVAISEDVNFWQLSVSYIGFGNDVDDLHFHEGGFYGIGVGYSRMNFEDIMVNGVWYDIGEMHEKSLDLNLIVGYKFESGFGIEAKWIVDEEAYTLSGSYWFE